MSPPLDYFTAQGKIDTARKASLLSTRYKDHKPASRQRKTGEDAEFVTDLEQYENEQTAKAQLRSGALDRQEIDQGDEYDFVFDEEVKIGFLLDKEGGIEGSGLPTDAKDAALKAQIDEAERRGKST